MKNGVEKGERKLTAGKRVSSFFLMISSNLSHQKRQNLKEENNGLADSNQKYNSQSI